MHLKRIVEPTLQPIDRDAVKTYLKIDSTDLDDQIDSFIISATQLAQEYTGRSFLSQSWQHTLDACEFNFPLYLPYPLIQSVTSITITDEDNNSSVWSDTNYILKGGQLLLASDYKWPNPYPRVHSGVDIEYIAGWENVADVPEAIKTALALQVAAFMECAGSELHKNVMILLRSFKVYKF